MLAGLMLAVAGPGIATVGQAAPTDNLPPRERVSPEPVLDVQPPEGHCAFDAAGDTKPGLETGFEAGLKSGTELLALYVPCTSLAAARAGTLEWLPEWVAIEKNTVTYPSDDDRSLGTYGAVRQLCQDAQSARWGHPRNDGKDFAFLVKEANARLSYETPVVFLGVVGEEDHACYMAATRILFSPSGKAQRFLVVTAFMQAGDRWVTQSIRRELIETRAAAEAQLADSKRESKSFAERNR
ncbi:MAG: hypothetical protein ACM3L9_05295 [Deltaproteobacteria bacterium]